MGFNSKKDLIVMVLFKVDFKKRREEGMNKWGKNIRINLCVYVINDNKKIIK